MRCDRMLTTSEPKLKPLDYPYNPLRIPFGGQKLNATREWL